MKYSINNTVFRLPAAGCGLPAFLFINYYFLKNQQIKTTFPVKLAYLMISLSE